MGKNLIVLFPGINYSPEKPLLYYIDCIYDIKGYDQLKLHYESLYQPGKIRPMEELIEEAKQIILQQIETFDWKAYDQIVFASKSIGTVLAGWLQEKLGHRVQQIYLTPLPQTLPYLTKEKSKDIVFVAAGTLDKYLSPERLRDHCKAEGIALRQFEGVGHRMESATDVLESIEIVREIMKEIKERIQKN